MDMENHTLRSLMALVAIGALVGLGQLLADPGRQLTIRVVIGRALTSGALGMGAAAALMVRSDLPFEAVAGLAAMMASLGTSFFERVLMTVIRNKTE